MEAPRDTGVPYMCFEMHLMGQSAQDARAPCQGTPSTPWARHTHLELEVRVFQELLVHGFCELVDSPQEDPGREEQVTRPSEYATPGIPLHLPE